MFLDLTIGNTTDAWAQARQMCKALMNREFRGPIDVRTLPRAQKLLENLAKRLADANWKKQLSEAMSHEGKRPKALCELEVVRSVQTLEKTKEALQSLVDLRALDFSDAVQGGHKALLQRFPLGPLFAISPFNFPLNLSLHKIAPAMALGIPFVCKGPEQNPVTFQLLENCLQEAGLGSENHLLLVASGKLTSRLLEEFCFPLISFTGSYAVGTSLKKAYWDRKVILELGSTAAALLCQDVPRWELEKLTQSLCKSAFAQAGQSCISLQHLFVEKELLEDTTGLLKITASQMAAKKDLSDVQTLVSPLVHAGAFSKALELVNDAKAHGAEVWSAAPHDEALNHFAPTLVFIPERACASLRLFREEVFAPVLCVHSIASPEKGQEHSPSLLKKALDSVDANIHASVFSYNAKRVNALFEVAPGHCLLWNEVPSWRADAMPYGGTLGASGLVGEEGPMSTLKEYTWERMLVLP
jgi:acyl-CoA reductase-like NAD-dependent aldehyde dehydrogenase